MRSAKNKLTYRWARNGSRPRVIRDERTQWTYLFNAVCHELGTGAAAVLACNTEAMQLHLDEIRSRRPGASHPRSSRLARRQRHQTFRKYLAPAAAATRNGIQRPGNIWRFIRQNWLSNRIFKNPSTISSIAAWNTLIDQPWKIMSIAQRDWAAVGHLL
jgi:hypothetical protein